MKWSEDTMNSQENFFPLSSSWSTVCIDLKHFLPQQDHTPRSHLHVNEPVPNQIMYYIINVLIHNYEAAWCTTCNDKPIISSTLCEGLKMATISKWRQVRCWQCKCRTFKSPWNRRMSVTKHKSSESCFFVWKRNVFTFQNMFKIRAL